MIGDLGEFTAGNIHIRKNIGTVGDQTGGHTHNFDHVTIVFKGKVHVSAWRPGPDNTKIPVAEQDFDTGSYFLVKADVCHDITFIEDGEFWCVYSHRDPQGEVVQEHNGWLRAYV